MTLWVSAAGSRAKLSILGCIGKWGRGHWVDHNGDILSLLACRGRLKEFEGVLQDRVRLWNPALPLMLAGVGSTYLPCHGVDQVGANKGLMQVPGT